MLDLLPVMPELPVAPPVFPATVPHLEQLSALSAPRANIVLPAVHRLAPHVVMDYILVSVRPRAIAVVRVRMSIVAELARIVWRARIPAVQDNRPVLHARQDFTHPLLVRQAARSA